MPMQISTYAFRTAATTRCRTSAGTRTSRASSTRSSTLRELDVVRASGPREATAQTAILSGCTGSSLNHYKPRAAELLRGLAEAGGALFPWHTDLAANGEMTMISTLQAPAIDDTPHADPPPATSYSARARSLGPAALSGPARWGLRTAQCRNRRGRQGASLSSRLRQVAAFS